jgi:small subunit ribosomal protein S2
MRELLEAGVHFGHQTRRWNPKMRRFIHMERGGIYIIDLRQTLDLVERAHDFARNIASRGGTILFVGTKKQAQDAIAEEAKRVGMPYVNHRWLGGLLTNWRTISDRIDRLHELRRLREEGQLELLPAKERMSMLGELEKLDANLGGVADLRRQPDAIFIVDLKKEQLAVREARRLGLPVVALVDTNCDPDEADYVIPGNDDAIRACNLITRVIADGIAAGKGTTVAEFDGGEPEAESTAEAQAEPEAGPEAEAQPAPEAGPEAETQPAPEAETRPEVAQSGVELDAPPEHEQLGQSERAAEAPEGETADVAGAAAETTDAGREESS